jgi:hypothetical protein
MKIISGPKRSGSSILMVLLVISGVLIVVFAAQRISLVQFSQSSREEDNILAYYAAKAGIEDGLARFRFNRDAQTLNGKVFRFGLTNAKYPQVASFEVDKNEELSSTIGIDYDPKNQYYDLEIKYKVPSLGFTANGTVDWASAKSATKDTVVELTGFEDGTSGLPYYLRHAFQFLCTDNRAFVQIEQITERGQVLTQKQVRWQNNATYDSKDFNENWEIRTASDLTTKLRFRPYYCDVKFALITSATTSGTGVGTNSGPPIDSLTTVITSTGYYGSSKRTLVAEVDRISGTLIGVYDYNLYAGGGNVSR